MGSYFLLADPPYLSGLFDGSQRLRPQYLAVILVMIAVYFVYYLIFISFLVRIRKLPDEVK